MKIYTVKKSCHSVISSLLAIGLILSFHSTTALAGELELSDAQNAKLARQKAKERVMKNEDTKDYVEEMDEDDALTLDELNCGSVNIGNVVNKKGFGGPKEIDVIITGDVINTNNKCR